MKKLAMETKVSGLAYSALQNGGLTSSALASSGALDYFLTRMKDRH